MRARTRVNRCSRPDSASDRCRACTETELARKLLQEQPKHNGTNNFTILDVLSILPRGTTTFADWAP